MQLEYIQQELAAVTNATKINQEQVGFIDILDVIY